MGFWIMVGFLHEDSVRNDIIQFVKTTFAVSHSELKAYTLPSFSRKEYKGFYFIEANLNFLALVTVTGYLKVHLLIQSRM